jgi:hypothetical protein
MSNPLVAQGVLNRLKAQVVWNANPDLNVTASYLGVEGIRLSLDGGAAAYLPSMTGAVISPEPYQMITLAFTLLKTQQLADLYKQRMEENSQIGDGVVYPDVPPGSGVNAYQIINCSIESVAELNFAGTDAGYRVTCRGYYLVNNNLWN